MSATVVYVWGDYMVNVAILDHVGRPAYMTSVPLVQPGDTPPEQGMYCEWPDQKVAEAMLQAKNESPKPESRWPVGCITFFQPDMKLIDIATGTSLAPAVKVKILAVHHEDGKVLYDLAVADDSDGGFYEARPLKSVDSFFVVGQPSGARYPNVGGASEAKLYSSIGEAMKILATLPESFNMTANKAYNVLHSAYWSEVPAPARSPKRNTVAPTELN